ncbi:MAG: hypothetical protein ACLSGB_01030 [Dorea sp.]
MLNSCCIWYKEIWTGLWYCKQLYSGWSICAVLVYPRFAAGTGAHTSAWILLFILTIVTLVGWIGSYALSRKYVEK